MVPSVERLAQAFTFTDPSAGAGASAAPPRSSVRRAAQPSIRTVKVRPAAPTMNSRRVVMALALLHGAFDRAHDARIGAAAAHVRAHVVLDLCARRARVRGEQCRGAHQLARLPLTVKLIAISTPFWSANMLLPLQNRGQCCAAANGVSAAPLACLWR